MKESWQFIVVRSRDGYSTQVTVPKSEYPDHGAALRRVWEEFDPKVWWVKGGVSNQERRQE